MADDATRSPMSFPEFGVRFIHAALTPARLKARISGLIAPLPEIPIHGVKFGFGDATVNGALTSVEVTDLTPGELQQSAVFDVRLGVHLHIVVNFFNAILPWEGDFVVPVQMPVTAYTPLELELGYRPVIAQDIASAMTGTNWLAAIPELTAAAQEEVQKKMAEKVNEKLDAALADRRIDIAKALAALDAPEDPTAKPDPATTTVKPLSVDQAQPTVLAAGERFDGVVPLQNRAWIQVLVDPETDTKLTVAARVAVPTNSGAILSWKMIDPDGIVLDAGSTESIYEAQDFEPIELVFYHAERKGTAFIVLASEFNPVQVRGKLGFAKHA